MKKVLIILVVIACFAASMAGCAGGSQPSDTQTAKNESDDAPAPEAADEIVDEAADDAADQQPAMLIEPEQLISKDEAAALLGVAVKDGEKSQMESVGQKIVFYDPEEDGAFGFLQISLSQQGSMPTGSTITPEEIYGSAKAALDDTNDLEVSGVGDDCFTGTPGLHILSHGYYIVVGAGNSDDPDVQAIFTKAGELAVANLEKILAGQ